METRYPDPPWRMHGRAIFQPFAVPARSLRLPAGFTPRLAGGRALGGCRVRTEHQAGRAELHVQRSNVDARLHRDRLSLDIQVQDAGDILGEVHDQGRADCLPRQGGAATARQEWKAVARSYVN